MPYYSQNGEDEILAQLFRSVATGFCVEVGAHDGEHLSNSLHFEQKGWKCILVEPNPSSWDSLRSRRNAIIEECAASDRNGFAPFYVAANVEVLSTMVPDSGHFRRVQDEGGTITRIDVQTKTLDDILSLHSPAEIHFISIDVEGHELCVLRGLTLKRWRPRLLIVEDNSQMRDHSVVRLLRRNNYRRFYRTGCNDWYATTSDSDFGLLTLLRNPLFAPRRVLLMWLPGPLRRVSAFAYRMLSRLVRPVHSLPS